MLCIWNCLLIIIILLFNEKMRKNWKDKNFSRLSILFSEISLIKFETPIIEESRFTLDFFYIKTLSNWRIYLDWINQFYNFTN